MKTLNQNNGSLIGLANSGQATILNLTNHVRATAEKPRQLLDTRRRNDLLRELGKLHYDAHTTGNAPHQSSVTRLIAQLDAETRRKIEAHGNTEPHSTDETGKGDE